MRPSLPMLLLGAGLVLLGLFAPRGARAMTQQLPGGSRPSGAGADWPVIVPTWITPARGQQFEPEFRAAGARYGLPPGLLSRIAAKESNYNPAATSGAGAIGLMQIVPRWHPNVDPRDPVASIHYAASYLRQLYDRYGSWTLTLAGYNAGPGNVDKYGGVPPFAETRDYIAAILPDVGIREIGVRYA